MAKRGFQLRPPLSSSNPSHPSSAHSDGHPAVLCLSQHCSPYRINPQVPLLWCGCRDLVGLVLAFHHLPIPVHLAGFDLLPLAVCIKKLKTILRGGNLKGSETGRLQNGTFRHPPTLFVCVCCTNQQRHHLSHPHAYRAYPHSICKH